MRTTKRELQDRIKTMEESAHKFGVWFTNHDGTAHYSEKIDTYAEEQAEQVRAEKQALKDKIWEHEQRLWATMDLLGVRGTYEDKADETGMTSGFFSDSLTPLTLFLNDLDRARKKITNDNEEAAADKAIQRLKGNDK